MTWTINKKDKIQFKMPKKNYRVRGNFAGSVGLHQTSKQVFNSDLDLKLEYMVKK